MSRTWRQWGEERMERSLRKEHEDWKQEALRELEVTSKDELYSVYVIITEWAPDDIEDLTLQEIVGHKWFPSEDEAWDHLVDIADSYGVTLETDSTSFDVPGKYLHGSTADTYFIQELTR